MYRYLENFIRTHRNWIDEIQKEPYNIKVSRFENFVLLKYDQLNSNMSKPLCQVCRGIILEEVFKDDIWVPVCYPFNKFFNYGENEAAEIDWRTAIVREKIDGSLIKFWVDTCGNWHMSTNGSIDAFEATVSDSVEEYTFGDIVNRALGCNWLFFCKELDKNYTYMFELVSPDTQVTVHYPYDGLYYLGQRHRGTMVEEYNYNPIWGNFGIREPKVYHLSSLNDCISLVDEFTKDEEGVVVSDGNFNRIKIKSPQYLIAAHCANNGKLGLRTAIRLIRENKVDDFLAYAPMHRAKMELIVAAYEDIKDDLWHQFYKVRDYCWMSRKEYINVLGYVGLTRDGFNFAIWAYDHRENNINDYMNLLTERSIMNRIKDRVKDAKDELEVEDNE